MEQQQQQQPHSSSVTLLAGGGGGQRRRIPGSTNPIPNSFFLSPSFEGLESCDDQNITDPAIALNLKPFLPLEDVSPVVATLDLNRAAASPPALEAEEANATSSRLPLSCAGISIDLNAEDVSECGSTTGPAKDPLTRWNEMKKNGFLSTPHRGLLPGSGGVVASSSRPMIPVPNQRPKKRKSGFLPKKVESPTKREAHHPDKLAAPSGLLNGLNLGIINHVRNKKQVHSVIEAIVRSEALGNGLSQCKQPKCIPRETMDTGKHHLGPSHGNKNLKFPIPTGQSGSSMLHNIRERASVSHSAAIKEVESFRKKIESSAKAHEESSTVIKDASNNSSSATLLSTRAANVAAQWLELLNHDIKGHLSALRRSKKRVRSVITTELPFLISKEFSTDQENVFFYTSGSLDGLASNTLASLHLARWTRLFDQMDKTLTEEEKQLESWLCDVKEMQLRCDHGLQNVHFPGVVGTQHQGTLEYSNRTAQVDSRSTGELAVRAAAASIYSTCNFLTAKENVSCI